MELLYGICGIAAAMPAGAAPGVAGKTPPAAGACLAAWSRPGRASARAYLLLLLEDRPELLALRLLLLAPGLLLLLRLALGLLLRLAVLLRPLEAVPRLLVLREDGDADLEEGEELRDAMACSFGRG